MKFKTETEDGVVIVRVPSDALDAGNVMEFKNNIAPILESADKVVLNMGRVKFMDSSGVGAMLSCLRTMHAKNGELKLFGVRHQLVQLFKLVRLDRIIEVYDSKKAAVEAFKA